MTDLPRVTAILEAVGLSPDLSMVAPAILGAAQQRGSAVHQAVEGIVYGYLDEATVPPEAAPYVNGFRKFLADSHFEPIAAEILVTHAVWRFRGHVDVVGWLNALRTLLDVKTGASDGAEYQVAAYVEGWNHEHPDQPVVSGAVLHLQEDGTYRFAEVDLPHAVPVWHAAVTVYHAQSRPRKEVA